MENVTAGFFPVNLCKTLVCRGQSTEKNPIKNCLNQYSKLRLSKSAFKIFIQHIENIKNIDVWFALLRQRQTTINVLSCSTHSDYTERRVKGIK